MRDQLTFCMNAILVEGHWDLTGFPRLHGDDDGDVTEVGDGAEPPHDPPFPRLDEMGDHDHDPGGSF